MRIQSSAISMSSRTSFIQTQSKTESLRIWSDNEKPDSEGQNLIKKQLRQIKSDALELSEEAKSLSSQQNCSLLGIEEGASIELELSDKDKQKILIIERLLEALTGKKVKFHVPKKLKICDEEVNSNINLNRSNPPAQQRKGWGLVYDYKETNYEQQKMSFESNGIVKTADGREINFSVELNMSREFFSQKEMHIRAGDAKIDPLVINFDGNVPDLTDTKYSFDIDSDGTSEQLSFVSQGSGFLALDLNEDGIINNGSELFGPKSGDGFSELSQYDSDGNNWIDENDAIFDKLRIWTKDEQGNDVLFALGQKGIGAIYLGNVNTAFNIKDSQNDLKGSIAKSGIYLKEDGKAGTMQHIDLAI